MEKQIRIALAGNPNCGKALFKRADGLQPVRRQLFNVTVERKEGKLKKHDDVIIIRPAAFYSLSPLHAGGGRRLRNYLAI